MQQKQIQGVFKGLQCFEEMYCTGLAVVPFVQQLTVVDMNNFQGDNEVVTTTCTSTTCSITVRVPMDNELCLDEQASPLSY